MRRLAWTVVGSWDCCFVLYCRYQTFAGDHCSLYGVGYWNSFMSVMIYINDTSKYNMTVLVQNMIMSNLNVQDFTDPTMISNLTPEGIRAAAVIVMVIPILVVYPFLQKYFVKGVMLGSIKG